MSGKKEPKAENLKFEEAFALLKAEADKVSSENVSLEDALEGYKNGKKYYEICRKKLDEVKQTIQIYDKETDTVAEFKHED